MTTIKDLKAMIAQPASKEWFKKHGAPKHKALSKMSNEDKSLKHHQILAKEEHKQNAPYIKKFGTFEQRFKKFSKWKDNK